MRETTSKKKKRETGEDRIFDQNNICFFFQRKIEMKHCRLKSFFFAWVIKSMHFELFF